MKRLKNAGFFRILLRFSGYLFILISASLPGCYSSTAVQGIPVADLVMAKDVRVTKRVMTEEEKKEITEMSLVHSNKTFIEKAEIPEYRLGPLDILEITSHTGETVETKTVTVDNRGKISYSFVDDLVVSDMSPSQLDETLTKRLTAYFKEPRIDVIVKEFKSKSATVLGEVGSNRASTTGQSQSARVYLEGKTNFTDLIALAGGYTINADMKNARLIRGGKSYLLNIYDIIEKGDTTQNVIIDDGDVVDIPQLPTVHERVLVMGEVNSQGIYSLRDAEDLLGAISLAGNVTSIAKEEYTLIVRGYGTEEKPLVMMADVKALLRNADLRQNIPLEEGDLVYVPREAIGDVNDWIDKTMTFLDFLFYPKEFESNYFTKNYLHINRD